MLGEYSKILILCSNDFQCLCRLSESFVTIAMAIYGHQWPISTDVVTAMHGYALLRQKRPWLGQLWRRVRPCRRVLLRYDMKVVTACPPAKWQAESVSLITWIRSETDTFTTNSRSYLFQWLLNGSVHS